MPYPQIPSSDVGPQVIQPLEALLFGVVPEMSLVHKWLPGKGYRSKRARAAKLTS